MTSWPLTIVLLLSPFFRSSVASDEPIPRHGGPDIKPDIDFNPSYRIPEPETTTWKRSHSHDRHHSLQDFSALPSPPGDMSHWNSHHGHLDDYDYYPQTETTESGDYDQSISYVAITDEEQPNYHKGHTHPVFEEVITDHPSDSDGRESTNDHLSADASVSERLLPVLLAGLCSALLLI